ncbi:MAG: hypothetical protein E6Q32_06505 [Neisseriales bacterium]|nr:MAG: hypothetical protein E6Q32_06505 [Neisseriales bacterium]
MEDIQNQYISMFTRLLQEGYYDPEDSYANHNVDFLKTLESKDETCHGQFLFKLKLSEFISTVRVGNDVDRFSLSTSFPVLINNAPFNHAIIDNFLQKAYCPTIYLYTEKENTSIFLEYNMFLPFNEDQIMKVVKWFDQVVMQFIEDYNRLVKEFKEKQNVN